MSARAGFTLIETIVAMLLSSIVVVLVSTTFLVQNRYYSNQTLHVGAHDNARAATERMAREVRDATDEGFVVAGARTLSVRSPIALAVVCERNGNEVDVHVEGGSDALDVDEVAGLALRDPVTGGWEYEPTTWSYVDGGSLLSAARCADNGADTTWASSEFHQLDNLQLLFGGAPDLGSVLMFYRESTFRITQSVLEPTTLGLFREAYGQSPVEFVTGMDTTARFQYRTGGSTYADTVTGTAVEDIDAVRIVADVRNPPSTGGQEPVSFGWSVNVALRNVQ